MFQASKAQSGEVFQSLAANFSQLARNQREITRSIWPASKYSNPTQKPDWLLQCPSNLHEVKQFNGMSWYFCTKCGRNGRWVCTYRDSTHGDSRSSSPSSPSRSLPKHPIKILMRIMIISHGRLLDAHTRPIIIIGHDIQADPDLGPPPTSVILQANNPHAVMYRGLNNRRQLR